MIQLQYFKAAVINKTLINIKIINKIRKLVFLLKLQQSLKFLAGAYV